MRILHVCLRYPPATGGVENYVQNIVTNTRQLRADLDVRVLTSRLRTHHPPTLLNPDLLLDDPPYVQRLHHLTTPYLAYPRLQALPYYIAHHNPDIIEGYSFWYQPADAAARYSTRFHKPFVFHPMFYANAIRQKWPWRLYNKYIGMNTFAAADATVVISPHEQELISKAGYPVNKFHLIPPGIEPAHYIRNRLNPYLKRGIKGRILLAVSRLAPGKGLEDLIIALPAINDRVPAVQLAIIGEDFGAKKDLVKLAHDNNTTPQIHWLGRLPDEELYATYQHADLLVHPSYYEAFGIVLAESLAAGTPVVARNTSAIPFVAPHAKASLLFNDSSELVTHVVKLLTDQKLSQHLSRQGKQHIANNFTLAEQTKKITALYDELLEQSRDKGELKKY